MDKKIAPKKKIRSISVKAGDQLPGKDLPPPATKQMHIFNIIFLFKNYNQG